ncbi:Uncharacterized protein conserved in bacteria [Buttiauxella agrestis]|uniref:Uncharacterized protein conserved in bacteria n=1 Tax=Buttiauxella agrestis TaxID=82977 RepID=A0A381KPI9_9ENTR|nr:VasL domain-containing protein [Buttiauxella agrestis]SUY92697.1 Uncharacterized protein conserved in bacteria [Buttiauxella agrestis]
MTKINYAVKPGELKINCHDPRYRNEFLLLSNNVHSWKNHVHDRSWWLTQEKQCLELFQRFGYDLQSGVWFCLISCQRHGWAGIANSTLLLADAFNKQQRQCWPPIAAIDLRQQIIEWYCTHAAPCIYGLPLQYAETTILQQLEGAVSMLLTAQVMIPQSRSQVSLRSLLDYLQASRQSLQKRVLVPKATVINAPPITEALQSVSVEPPLPGKRPLKALLLGGITGIAFTLTVVSAVHWLEKPSVAISLNKIWPGNFISKSRLNALAEQTASLPTINSWALVNSQLNNLEQRLLEAEQKRKPYMTISELKTEIYKMRQTLQQGGAPVQAQLDDLQVKLNNQQPVSPGEINAISQHLTALNSRLIQLTNRP